MSDVKVDPVYYRNRAGAIALSLDDGDTLVLPTGQRIDLNPMWEEVDPVEEGSLTKPQQEAIAEARAAPAPSTLDTIIKDYGRARRDASRDYGPGSEGRPIRRLPEDVLVVVADFD